MGNTTIQISEDVRAELSKLKYEYKFKDYNEVIKNILISVKGGKLK